MNTKDYLKYIVGQDSCLVCTHIPEHHHLEAIGMGGDRRKQTIKDYSCIELCWKHHIELHDIGRMKFEVKYGINLWQEAFKLLRKYFLDDKEEKQ